MTETMTPRPGTVLPLSKCRPGWLVHWGYSDHRVKMHDGWPAIIVGIAVYQGMDVMLINTAPTPDPTLADLAAQVAELRARVDALEEKADECLPTAADVRGIMSDAPDFTTSRKPEPGGAVMGKFNRRQGNDAEIISSVRARWDVGLADYDLALWEVMDATRASIRAQLKANEAGAVKEGAELIERSITPIEKAIAAALKAHGEGV